MSEAYTQFSEKLYDLTDEEIAWIEAYLGNQSDDCSLMFEWELDGNDLWIFDEGNGSPEDVGYFVRDFLAMFRPDEVWSMQWAYTNKDLRLGAFGGGAMVVTAKNVYIKDTHHLVRQLLAKHEESKHGNL